MRKRYHSTGVYSTFVGDPTVIVVGAGVAGLACARDLTARRIPNVLLEAERTVGGRCATTRTHGQLVDHGLPFLHAKSGEFGEALNQLDPDGKVLGWPSDVREPRLMSPNDALKPGRRRMARRGGVHEFAEWLARGLDVRLGDAVVALEDLGAAVRVRSASGAAFEAPFVILACPLRATVALAAPLVVTWPGAAARIEPLARIRPLPALTVIAGYDPAAFDVPFHLWSPLETTMLHLIVHDSSKREAPRERVLVLHARARYSSEHLGDPPEAWRDELLWELGEILDRRAEAPRWSETHVWADARIADHDRQKDGVVFQSEGGASVALVGDAFGHDPGVEGAYFSGLSFAEQIALLLATRAGKL
jgi:predicted NAD/FAD-dependent oxidoreductase